MITPAPTPVAASTLSPTTNYGIFLDGRAYKTKQLRRSSSLQLPLSKNQCQQNSQHLLVSALSTLKSSTASIYTSTLSVIGFGTWPTNDVLTASARRSDSAVNLYTLMAKYRCCCGLCRLRLASFAIAILCMICSLMVIALLMLESPFVNEHQRKLLALPTTILMGYQLLASTLLLTGVSLDMHHLLLPFQASCVLNVMASMALGLMLLISTDRLNAHLYPLFAILSTSLIGVYLYFLVIISMTFVLIRDKKKMIAGCEEDFGEDLEALGRGLERVNSADF